MALYFPELLRLHPGSSGRCTRPYQFPTMYKDEANSHAGLIITVSVLVAAGIAVYESPQFQQWVTTSRRKIAVALHNLGDEIQPQDIALREDISMTEETGEVAEERRRIARAEIMRRGTILESRRKASQSGQPHNSFDTLVDNEGNLLKQKDHEYGVHSSEEFTANSTGVDLGTSEPLRRGGKQIEADSSTTPGRNQLHVDIPSSAPSNHPSESTIQFTPGSEALDGDRLFDPFSPKSPLPASGSSHTEDHQQVYYAHPDVPTNGTYEHDHLAELDGFGHESVQSHNDISAAPSTSGSFSHVGGFEDETSDGTLSDLGGRSVGGVATPAWSDVGSVISNEDAGHHQLL
ncbi:unnamed protein product [Penicillium nalgiovense]|uniref:Uncharacterized protein n=1 Tax=Penicillium nalgiovense TaxID=60175 RepID=A0A9W4I238_PENNA|nr:unnamed protein product [Penicillium nalgiovense]CAG7978925.1 unnamed protein product [Penicillium nalgiovense]CAG7982175.1 unnamed protein product [Penicillium nalgiovense]CAG7982936.1 unnamed protein product [Penicillium nalgiovense]CAG7990706.1 unnamed protein product [Penicillium nalgiovense]